MTLFWIIILFWIWCKSYKTPYQKYQEQHPELFPPPEPFHIVEYESCDARLAAAIRRFNNVGKPKDECE